MHLADGPRRLLLEVLERGDLSTPAGWPVVTDVGWVRHTVNALRFVIPGEARVFPTNQAY